MSTNIPNVITGVVTRRARVRHTPNWLKAVYAVLFTLFAIIVVSLLFGTPAGDVLKPCKSESDTSACYWDADTQGNGKGRDFVNR